MLFDFESHTSIQPYIKSIDFLHDEGENKQNMPIFVLGCSTPLREWIHYLYVSPTATLAVLLAQWLLPSFNWRISRGKFLSIKTQGELDADYSFQQWPTNVFNNNTDRPTKRKTKITLPYCI